MKWATSGQIAAIVTLASLIALPCWPFLAAFLGSIFLICLETYLVARVPQLPTQDIQKQISDLKDQLGNVQLAMGFMRKE